VFALGSVCALPPWDAPLNIALPTPTSPTPEVLMQAFASANNNFLGTEWHPGVYLAWYVLYFSGQHLVVSNEWYFIGILQLVRVYFSQFI
jgi:hypothetical protein